MGCLRAAHRRREPIVETPELRVASIQVPDLRLKHVDLGQRQLFGTLAHPLALLIVRVDDVLQLRRDRLLPSHHTSTRRSDLTAVYIKRMLTREAWRDDLPALGSTTPPLDIAVEALHGHACRSKSSGNVRTEGRVHRGRGRRGGRGRRPGERLKGPGKCEGLYLASVLTR